MTSIEVLTADRFDSEPGLQIRNPLAAAKAAIPAFVEIRGDRLRWTRDESDEAMNGGLLGFHEGESVEGAIWAFMELIDKPAEAFADFARRYGVLGIREDGLPGTADLRDAVRSYPPHETDDDGAVWFVETLASWRMYAVALRSVLALATGARDRGESSYKEVLVRFALDRFNWESFGEPIAQPGEESASSLYLRWLLFLSPDRLAQYLDDKTEVDVQSVISSFVSNTWLRYGSLVPVIAWEDGQSRMTLSLGSRSTGAYPTNMLFSVLSAQLAALLTSDGFERLDQCSVCGRIFVTAIRPGRHTRAYCVEHKLEGERERKRRWARKVAAERKAKPHG